MRGIIAGFMITAATLTLIPETLSKKQDKCQPPSDAHNPCGVLGVWKNELGSKMNITCDYGLVIGWYYSAVGKAQDAYALSGTYTMAGENMTDTVIAWTVAWNNKAFGNSNSSTAWTGIHYPEEGIIHTQWILISHKTRPNLWQTSMIGHDEFKRDC